jgi:hypothetical protein
MPELLRCTLCKLTGQDCVATVLAWKRPRGAQNPGGPERVGLCDSHRHEVFAGKWPGYHAIHSRYDADNRSWCPDCQDRYASRSRSSNRVAAGEGESVAGDPPSAAAPDSCS